MYPIWQLQLYCVCKCNFPKSQKTSLKTCFQYLSSLTCLIIQLLCFLFSASKGRSVAPRRSSQSRPVRKRSKENQSMKKSNLQIMKFKYWKLWKLTNAQRAMSKNHLQKIHTHFESNFWEAWTRIASSLSRVWASPAFTVIFLSKNNIDLFKAEKFYDHRRPLMFNVFTFKLHIVTQSHSIHLWDHISPYILFKLN